MYELTRIHNYSTIKLFQYILPHTRDSFHMAILSTGIKCLKSGLLIVVRIVSSQADAIELQEDFKAVNISTVNVSCRR